LKAYSYSTCDVDVTDMHDDNAVGWVETMQ